LLILVAALAWLALSPPRAVEAARLLFELATGGAPAITPAPVAWRTAERAYRGDLYGAPDAARAALLLVPGAAEAGKDDPRLVTFARALAAADFLVLVPDLPGPKALQVSSEDIVEIADAAVYLAGLPHGRGPLGLAAISYGVGPAVLAALDDPRLNQGLAGRVAFILAIGGYDDLTAVITFFTTGYWRAAPDQPWRLGKPNAYGKWVFVLANAARLDDGNDRARLAAIARRKLADLDADIRPLEAALGPEGRAVMALLDNRDPTRVPALIASLPPRITAEIVALDLAGKDLTPLHAEVLLIHGRDDAIVPYSESVTLARALGPRAHLYLLDSLAHASMTPARARDAWLLWQAALRLLAIRDGED
jgi:pimeloyl-ACP methyl ester carboxylesterase